MVTLRCVSPLRRRRVATTSTACSPATMGMNRMASALSATAAAYGRDDDPEFVRSGAPSTLKMVEMMLDTQSRRTPACCSPHAVASRSIPTHFCRSTARSSPPPMRARVGRTPRAGGRMYWPGTSGTASASSGRAGRPCARRSSATRRACLPRFRPQRRLTCRHSSGPAAAWAGELSIASQSAAADRRGGHVRALFTRALALDEGWGDGTIHEAMIAVEGLPAIVGGSPVRAREHFERAVALSGGQSAFAYVTLATSVSAPAKDRAEYERSR